MNKIVLLTFFSAFLTQNFVQVKVANNDKCYIYC